MKYPTDGREGEFEFKVAVIKVGSMVLTEDRSRMDMVFIAALARLIRCWMDRGRKVILVSSGAVAAGLCELGDEIEPRSIPEKQALAAIGQLRLMATYGETFSHQQIRVAQILLTQKDMDDRQRYLNARLALEALLERGILPVINENDATAIDELKFGDNDMLSARVAAKMQAELLLILSDIDGLYDRPPDADGAGAVVPLVKKVTPETYAMCRGGERSFFGLGGMRTKIEAAELAARAGIHTIIANGKRLDALERLMDDRAAGTVFLPSARGKLSRRSAWIAAGRASRGRRIVIDAGAAAKIRGANSSLLAAGISAVEGRFAFGDVADIVDPDGAVIARGLCNYGSDEVERIKGLKSSKIVSALGHKPYDEVIHRDNLVVL